MARITLLVVLLLLTSVAQGQTRIAVASNFETTAQALSEKFFDDTGERVTLISGSTEQLAQQVRQGVGFDAFLAGGKERVTEMVDSGLAVEDSYFVYAKGRLALLADSAENDEGHGPEEMLREESYESLAVPDNRETPYGRAAAEVLDEVLGSRYGVRRQVQGNSSAQAFQFMRSGSVDLGFVPLSLVKHHEVEEDRWWLVPAELHEPIEQAAVLLNEDSETARAFLEFMRSDEGRAIIKDAGYE